MKWKRTDRCVNGVAKVGDVVSYSDVCNSPEHMIVTGIRKDAWYVHYDMKSLEGPGRETSTLNQRGWTFSEERK